MGMDNGLPEGISVKPNGKYLARVRIGKGDRISKTFDTIPEARRWINKVKTGEVEKEPVFSSEMTLNKWFNFWIKNLVTDVRTNTLLSYKSKYNTWIKPVLGKMNMADIRPYHCMEVLNNMREMDRKDSSIDQVRIVMHLLFSRAVENEVILSNPVTKSTKLSNKIGAFKDARFLTRAEHRAFLDEAVKHKHFDQFAFVLQTGLRYGELTGLRWSDIDLDNRVMHIERSASYLEDHGEFVVGPPKSAKGYRDIFLTDEAVEILTRKAKIAHETTNYIFLDDDGKPIKRAIYNMQLKRICEKIGIEPFSIHKLRHTFATRCIEAGVKPKTLQKILGHSDVTVTLNYYVHITDNELANEMAKFSALAV